MIAHSAAMTERNISLVILCGGGSRRMGFPKHLIRLGGTTIIEHLAVGLGARFDEVLVVGSDLPPALPHRIRRVGDLLPMQNPLVGIYSGLTAAINDLCFVLACDMPYVMPPLVDVIVRSIQEADVAVPVVSGHFEPLCAAYRRAVIPAARQTLDSRNYKVAALYEHIRVQKVHETALRIADPDLQSFININTKRELAALSAETPFLRGPGSGDEPLRLKCAQELPNP